MNRTGECRGSHTQPRDGRCTVCGWDPPAPRGRLTRHGRCDREGGDVMRWFYDHSRQYNAAQGDDHE